MGKAFFCAAVLVGAGLLYLGVEAVRLIARERRAQKVYDEIYQNAWQNYQGKDLTEAQRAGRKSAQHFMARQAELSRSVFGRDVSHGSGELLPEAVHTFREGA